MPRRALDWEGKEEECRRLYVDERKSFDEIQEFWEGRGFTARYVYGGRVDGGVKKVVR